MTTGHQLLGHQLLLDDIEAAAVFHPRDVFGLGTAFLSAPNVRAALLARRPITIEAAVSVTGAPIPPGTQLPALHETAFDSVAARFGQGSTSAGAIPYLREAFTNNANYVALGGVKPDSPDAFTLANQPVVKVAHLCQVPDEFLDDAEGLETYLNVALSEGLLARLDTELINGDGAAGHIQGLVGLTGKSGPVAGGAGVNMGAIGAAAGAIATASRRRADTVIVNPADWGKIATQGAASFPPGLVPVASGYLAVATAIVGAFKSGAMIFRRGGVVVQATTSHAGLFRENETVIRAELRVAVVHFVPAAFCLVTGIA
jgi:hypothetical protein